MYGRSAAGTSTDIARDRFSLNLFEIPRGTGTGFIYDRDGHIVTNFHVIAVGRRWIVTLADRTQLEARLVGAAEDKDLAVLKIDAPAEQLKPIEARQAEVEHDRRECVRGERELRSDAVLDPVGVEAALLQPCLQAIPQQRIIFDDQDAHRGVC